MGVSWDSRCGEGGDARGGVSPWFLGAVISKSAGHSASPFILHLPAPRTVPPLPRAPRDHSRSALQAKRPPLEHPPMPGQPPKPPRGAGGISPPGDEGGAAIPNHPLQPCEVWGWLREKVDAQGGVLNGGVTP